MFHFYLFFFADFSLVDWMVSHSIDHIENIQPPQASELLLQLGLDHFLSEPEKCTLLDAKYGAVDFNGWNNGMFLWGFFYLFSYYSILFKLMLHVFVFIDSIYIFSFVMGFFFEWYGHCFSFRILTHIVCSVHIRK